MRLIFLFSLAFLAFFLSIAANAQQQSYVFNRADFATGNQPRDIVIADFNGDGQADVAVANSDSISIHLGKANGTFADKVDYATDHNPENLVVGDFNKDGNIDLAVVDQNNKVFVLLGHGDGTFADPVDYPTAASPFGIVTGDFNGDGKLDLAVADGNCSLGVCQSGFVSILLGNGDGTFGPKIDFSVGQGAQILTAQDFNGDGKLDLAVTNNSTNTISILLGNGDGTFQPQATVVTAAGPSGIAAADFDGDKIIDLAITHTVAPWNLTVLKGNGDGTFQPETTIAEVTPTSFIKTSDINADGKKDLILSGQPVGITVFLGNGDGSFLSPLTFDASAIAGFAIADVNDDNNLDLATAGEQSNTFTVLLGNGNGTFSPQQTIPLGITNQFAAFPMTPIIGDFNGDGIPDLAMGEAGTGQIATLIGKGKGAFENVKLSSPGAFGLIAAADFNGDGILDMALTTGAGVAISFGNGDGTFGSLTPAASTSSTARGFVVGDLNNDGKPDLVVLGNGFVQTNPIYSFIGNGDGTFKLPKQFWSLTTIPTAIAAGDFNHDGNLDIVIELDSDSNGIAVMFGNGDGSFQAPAMYQIDDLPNGLTVADLNGDGFPDIIATGDKVDVFLNKGDGTFATAVNYDAGNFPQQVITGDFNGDGKVDIIANAEGPAALGYIEILFGNGDGTFQPPVEIQDGAATGSALAVGDLNQDGTSDLVLGAGFGTWFLSGPIATLSPAQLNFSTVNLGETSTRSVSLTNSGNGPLNLQTATTGPFTSQNNCANSLPISATCAFNVTFSPLSPGLNMGTLFLLDNAPQGSQTVLLTGSAKASFSLSSASGSSTSATVKAGSTASYSLNVTPLGGFSQSVSFSCSGAPATATCTVAPSSLTLDGATTSAVTVQVTTTAASAALIHPKLPNQGNSQSNGFLLALGIFPLGLLICSRIPKSKHTKTINMLLVFSFFAMATISCGGGGSTGTQGPTGPTSPGTPGTTAGNYTLTVTANSGSGSTAIQQTIQLMLSVN